MSYRPPLNSLLLGVAYFGAGISDASTHAYNGLVLAFFAILLYTIAESKFGEKTAYKAIILLIMVNPFFYSIAYKSQVYTFSAYISLCVYAIWIKKINYKVLGAYAALAYLAHPMSQIFLASMILVETIKFKNTSIPWKEISIGIVLCLIIISPWLIRNYSLFGNPIYTSGKYVMFTRDLEQYFSLDIPKPMDYIEHISNPVNMVMLKGGSLWKTFLPPPYSIAFKRFQPQALIHPVTLETTLAGLLSYPILFASIWFLMKNPREKISLLFMLGVFASLIVFGYRVSYTYSLLLPQAMLVAIYAFEKIQNKKWILYLAFAQMLLSAPILFSNDMQYNEDVGYQWIKENIDANQKIMSRHYAMINYVTGHDTIPTPYPGISEIKKVSEKYGIEYYAVNKEDLRLRDFTLSELNESFEYVDESGNFWFYRL